MTNAIIYFGVNINSFSKAADGAKPAITVGVHDHLETANHGYTKTQNKRCKNSP